MPTTGIEKDEIDTINGDIEELISRIKEEHLIVLGDMTDVVGEFRLGKRRYTWKMPGDIKRYQIDFIIVKQRFKNQVKDSRTYTGCDLGSILYILGFIVLYFFVWYRNFIVL